MHAEPLDDLTDALARGRLTAAELAGLTPRELDAVFAAGSQRLDDGRWAEAAVIFGALAALFPYGARTWRAWGVALHRLLECERARAAYDAALLLEPDHLHTLCYRGEVLLYLGRTVEARADLERVARSGHRTLSGRARTLLIHLDRLAGWQPLPERPPPPPSDATLSLADGRSLPLEASRFTDEDAPVTREITQTARLFAPQPLEHEVTDTAVIPGRPRAPTAPLPPLDATSTDVVDRRGAPPLLHPGDTDLIDRRESENTAVVRRRLRQALTSTASVTDVLPGRRRPR
jgi:tetratricopeptide (TPR) repeat protein